MIALSTPTTLSDRVIAAIRTVINSDSAVLHESGFKSNEWLYLKECLDSTFVSSVCQFLDSVKACCLISVSSSSSLVKVAS